MHESAPALDPLLGVTMGGRWRIRHRIGTGSMGIVYLAESVENSRQGALKLLHEEYVSSDEFVRRFAREARALSRLQHVHCTSILDVGEYEDRPYIVMELVPGHRLTTEIATPAMNPVRAVTLMRQVMMGLQHAHSHGVVHRDIKPDNLMITELAGVGDVVKILDFGFAHIADSHHSKSNAELVPGTPSYLSPEQARGVRNDPRSDLYAAGVILYECCVGQKPFSGKDALDVVSKHLHDQPVPPRFVEPSLSQPLEKVILRAMAKDCEARFADANAFRAALEATPEGRRLGLGTTVPALRSRRWMLVAAAIGLATVGLIVYGTRSSTPAPAPTPIVAPPPPDAAPPPDAMLPDAAVEVAPPPLPAPVRTHKRKLRSRHH